VLSLENQIIKTVGPLFAELEVRVLEYTVPGGALNTDGTVTRVTKVLDQKSAMVTAAIPVGFGNSASPVTVVVSRYVSWEQREAELRQRINVEQDFVNLVGGLSLSLTSTGVRNPVCS